MPKGWKLLWGPTAPDVVAAAEAYPYYRVGADTTLCYGRRQPVDGLRVADDRFVRQMTPDEQMWLKCCIDRVVAEKAARNKAQRDKSTWAFLYRYEAELEAARKQMESGVTENAAGGE